MHLHRSLPFVVGAILLAGCQDTAQRSSLAPTEPSASRVGAEQLPTSATVNFGAKDVGSPFPPGGHDQSTHAQDKLRPRTVVIQQGGSVTFIVGPTHRVAIYEPGTRPEDIDVNETTTLPFAPIPINLQITDSDGLVDAEPLPASPQEFFSQRTFTSSAFTQPGRYLVICTTQIHFIASNMYGWVEVK